MIELIGHEKQKNIFLSTLKSKKFHNGYIFSGKEGIGKKLFALEFARSILCSKQNHFKDCDCEECKLALNHPDLELIDLESINKNLSQKEKKHSISIEIVRNLSEFAQTFPSRAKNKVCIINDVHLMLVDAANAFLKTLEEPANGVIFILITHKYEKLLPTIKSRCINIEFSRLKDSEIKQILEKNSYENINNEIIKSSSGSVLTAIDFINKQEKGLQITLEMIKDKDKIVTNILGVKDKEKMRNLILELYKISSDLYSKNKSSILLDFSEYLLEISKRLDYNVNFDIFKADLISKIIGVLREEI
jgi:DNA polymerase-3 subunit delta'